MIVLKEFKGIFEVDKAFYEVFKECISKDETRLFLTAVYFDGPNNTFVATDGRRLIKHTPVEQYGEAFTGYYDLTKIGKKYKCLPKEMEGQFPNWQRVVDSTNDYSLLNIESYNSQFNSKKVSTSLHTITGDMSHNSLVIGNIILENNTPINFDFVAKVLKHVGAFEVLINRSPDSQVCPILFIIDPNTTYMIQPMQR